MAADPPRQSRRRRLRHAGARGQADARRRLDRRHRLTGGVDGHAGRSRLHGDEACGDRLGAGGGAGARRARDPGQCALSGLRRYPAGRPRAAWAARRAAHGAVVRRRGRGARSPRRRDGPRLGRAAQPRRAVPLPRRTGAAMCPRARKPWGEFPPPDPHVWNTLRYRGVEQADGRAVIEWDATAEYSFHAPSGPIVHGGMVAALLDTAMGGACWTLMTDEEDFLTADLRTEFHRSARPGTLRAEGWVVQRNRRVVFCAAELYQDGELIASARCTQIVRSTG